MHELNKLLLEQSYQLAHPVTEADPLAWAQTLFGARSAANVPDLSAAVEAAASQATAGLPWDSLPADLQAAAKSAASIAAAGAAQQLAPEFVAGSPPVGGAPAGSGLGLLLVFTISMAKAGKLLL